MSPGFSGAAITSTRMAPSAYGSATSRTTGGWPYRSITAARIRISLAARHALPRSPLVLQASIEERHGSSHRLAEALRDVVIGSGVGVELHGLAGGFEIAR